jgi:hypothetical protein
MGRPERNASCRARGVRNDDLLTELRAERRGMAVVVDESGATAGIVTIEDSEGVTYDGVRLVVETVARNCILEVRSGNCELEPSTDHVNDRESWHAVVLPETGY